jgi:hypothetical protein
MSEPYWSSPFSACRRNAEVAKSVQNLFSTAYTSSASEGGSSIGGCYAMMSDHRAGNSSIDIYPLSHIPIDFALIFPLRYSVYFQGRGYGILGRFEDLANPYRR